MWKLFFLFIIGVLFSKILLAQDHSHEHHKHSKNEIGIGYSPVYFLNESELNSGLHLHIVRTISDTKFGIGLSYEQIFDEHKHKTYGLLTTYRPIQNLSFGLSPGLAFEANSQNPKLAFHFETIYEFELKYFHVGPAFEIALDREDIHLSLGIHFGFGF